MKYFKQFPEVVYNNYTVKNVLARVKISDLVKTSRTSYLPYTMDDSDAAWVIANSYYGSPDYVWLVYMSNDIVDPYYDWYKNTLEFESYIKKKYGSIEAAQAEIIGYKEVVNGAETGIIYSPESYTYSTDTNKTNWLTYYAYDKEDEENEARRTIQLLNNSYAKQAEANLKDLLKRG